MRLDDLVQKIRRAKLWRSLTAFDAVVALIAGFVGYASYLGSWAYQRPVLNLSSDAGNIVSFVAASAGKDIFVGDEILGNPQNYREYMTLQIPLCRLLSSWTGGDYGAAFLLPAPVLGFAQLLGFYLFGVMVTRSRALAAVFAGMSLCVVELPTLDEAWGPLGHGTPREWFQAFLPYILCAAWKWRSDPRGWAVVLLALGSMAYVHPVSTPGWATAIWLGFLISRPAQRSWARQIGLLLSCTPAFFVAATPFIVNYLREHDYGVGKVPYDVVFPILKERYNDGYLDLPLALSSIGENWQALGLPIIGVLGAVALLVAGVRRADRRLMGAWIGGLILMSAVVPVIEHQIAANRQAIPVQVDLIRSLRYLVPLIELVVFWGVAELLRRWLGNRKWLFPVAAALAVVAVFNSHLTLDPDLVRGLQFAKGEPAPEASVRQRVFVRVKELTPPGAKLLASARHDALPLRFLSRRPVVYAFKDGGMLGYSNHEALVRWDRKRLAMRRLKRLRPAHRLGGHVMLARRFGADYLLYAGNVSPGQFKRLGVRLVLQEPGYALFDIRD